MASNNSQTIQVLVRARPLDNSLATAESSISIENDNKIIVERDKKGQAEFQFTKVYDTNSSNNDVFNSCNVIDDVISGINCCIMAYGQTGSGKTYTMFGKDFFTSNNNNLSKSLNLNSSINHTNINNDYDSDVDSIVNNNNGDNNNDIKDSISSPTLAVTNHNVDEIGVIPNTISNLFSILNNKTKENDKFEFSVSCQVMQIYNEKIYDLIQDRHRNNPLQIREISNSNENSNVYVRGISVYKVYNNSEVLALLKKGLRNRIIRSTDFNTESSRSHTILQLFITIEDVDSNNIIILKKSILSLVDLAGSEKWRSSLNNSANMPDNNIQVKEMTNINTSLHVLGNCVSALISNNRKHIPYRDSILTRLLQDNINGVGKTILIATVRSDTEYREESFATLQFANRASHIKMSIIPNIGIRDSMSLVEAHKQIKILRNKLNEIEKEKEVLVANNNSNNSSNGNNESTGSVDSIPGLQTSIPSPNCSSCNKYLEIITLMKKKTKILIAENQSLKNRLSIITDSTTALNISNNSNSNNAINNSNTMENKPQFNTPTKHISSSSNVNNRNSIGDGIAAHDRDNNNSNRNSLNIGSKLENLDSSLSSIESTGSLLAMTNTMGTNPDSNTDRLELINNVSAVAEIMNSAPSTPSNTNQKRFNFNAVITTDKSAEGNNSARLLSNNDACNGHNTIHNTYRNTANNNRNTDNNNNTNTTDNSYDSNNLLTKSIESNNSAGSMSSIQQIMKAASLVLGEPSLTDITVMNGNNNITVNDATAGNNTSIINSNIANNQHVSNYFEYPNDDGYGNDDIGMRAAYQPSSRDNATNSNNNYNDVKSRKLEPSHSNSHNATNNGNSTTTHNNNNQASPDRDDGRCVKHGLEQCVLCMLMTSKSNKLSGRISSNSIDKPSENSPFREPRVNLPDVQPPANMANIDNSNKKRKKNKNNQYSNDLAEMSNNNNNSISNDTICKKHGMIDCLLCTLQNNNNNNSSSYISNALSDIKNEKGFISTIDSAEFDNGVPTYGFNSGHSSVENSRISGSYNYNDVIIKSKSGKPMISPHSFNSNVRNSNSNFSNNIITISEINNDDNINIMKDLLPPDQYPTSNRIGVADSKDADNNDNYNSKIIKKNKNKKNSTQDQVTSGITYLENDNSNVDYNSNSRGNSRNGSAGSISGSKHLNTIHGLRQRGESAIDIVQNAKDALNNYNFSDFENNEYNVRITSTDNNQNYNNEETVGVVADEDSEEDEEIDETNNNNVNNYYKDFDRKLYPRSSSSPLPYSSHPITDKNNEKATNEVVNTTVRPKKILKKKKKRKKGAVVGGKKMTAAGGGSAAAVAARRNASLGLL